ncbi:MAG TPA: NAD-dependent epimerase/dehydratase family protein [Pseudolabrys sp.]|jgi:nucleoside-diphosphate-sugar epimerase
MQLADETVLVTGGAGLIGSFLVERLVAAGARVTVADDFSKGKRDYLAAVSDRIEIREGDLERAEVMERALVGANIVFHLASRAYGIGYSADNHLAILEHNEKITNNLMHELAKRPVSHLLVASSSCVYPDDAPTPLPELPVFAGEPEVANSGYGWAKRFLEQKMTLLAQYTGISLTIVRPFNIYGERYTWAGSASQAIPMLVKKVMDGDDPVVIWGSGTQRRNYLHAFDCADAMAGLVESGFIGTVNIGSEDVVTIPELVRAIGEVAGRRPRLIADKTKPEGRSVKSANATRLRAAYPEFRRTVGLQDGLRRMLAWYQTTFVST